MSGPVIVSAHLDDAVLSAALQLMRPGAHVVTVCTGAPPDGTAPADWDRLTGAADAVSRVRERLVEDDRALAVLGVEATTRLDFPDAQHIARPEDRPAHDELVAALRPHLAGVAQVWVPAAVGGHLDHLAARDAAVAAADPTADLHYYADVPYSLGFGWPDVDAGIWRTPAEAARLTRTIHPLDHDAQRRKVAAMACYPTQLPALDPDGALTRGDPEVVGYEVSWSRPTP
jgi:LmbE family N-acetylglucosaminyl deacetylase